jgi:hydroxyisourate hydrolase
MSGISTHMLDTARGRPAAGVPVTLSRLDASGAATLLASTMTNADGRTDQPLLGGGDVTVGRYELVFKVGAYFADLLPGGGALPFLDEIPLRFAVADPQAHYHVPLLASPWSFSTYRGS